MRSLRSLLNLTGLNALLASGHCEHQIPEAEEQVLLSAIADVSRSELTLNHDLIDVLLEVDRILLDPRDFLLDGSRESGSLLPGLVLTREWHEQEDVAEDLESACQHEHHKAFLKDHHTQEDAFLVIEAQVLAHLANDLPQELDHVLKSLCRFNLSVVDWLIREEGVGVLLNEPCRDPDQQLLYKELIESRQVRVSDLFNNPLDGLGFCDDLSEKTHLLWGGCC